MSMRRVELEPADTGTGTQTGTMFSVQLEGRSTIDTQHTGGIPMPVGSGEGDDLSQCRGMS